MKLNYTFKHLDYSEALVNYAQARMVEISRFLLKEGVGNVYISKQNHEFCVEVSINTRERYFKATSFSPDVYEAVDGVADKLEKQFLKIKNQYKNHKKPELSRDGRFERDQRLRKAA